MECFSTASTTVHGRWRNVLARPAIWCTRATLTTLSGTKSIRLTIHTRRRGLKTTQKDTTASPGAARDFKSNIIDAKAREASTVIRVAGCHLTRYGRRYGARTTWRGAQAVNPKGGASLTVGAPCAPPASTSKPISIKKTLAKTERVPTAATTRFPPLQMQIRALRSRIAQRGNGQTTRHCQYREIRKCPAPHAKTVRT